ncbi:hypothetical protein C8J56DRAFT_1140184 [Mycena floridula]|nr:hypothetical protein C8J56DRAFT_1140184 [Mycena floridula]
MDHPGFPADVPMHSTPAYRIAETPDKGLGMFATRKIARGDFVLAERPLIFLPRSVRVGSNVKWYSEAQVMQIMKYEIEKVFEAAVGQLNDEEKRDLMALHNNHTQDGPILDRQRTNGFSKFPGLKDKGPAATAGFYDAMFKDGARINHSCSPNVVLQWDMASFSMQYCVRRDIEQDEEITISYYSLCQPASIRQETLDTFGFKCSCTACLHPEISDPRRKLISQIEEDHEEDLLNWAHQRGKNLAETFSKYSEGFNMCEEEGLEVHPAYAICAGILAKCYRVLKDEENVAKYLKLQSTALNSDED